MPYGYLLITHLLMDKWSTSSITNHRYTPTYPCCVTVPSVSELSNEGNDSQGYMYICGNIIWYKRLTLSCLLLTTEYIR